MRRWVLLLVAVALAAGPFALSAPATADDGCPCIVVTVAGGSAPPITFTRADYLGWIDQGVSAETFLLRNQPGATPQQSDYTPAGVSIPTLLQKASIDPGSVTFLQIPTYSGYVSTLTNPEAQADPSAFISGQLPTIYPIGTYAFGYARPLLSSDPPDSDPDHSDPDDVNNRDYFQTSSGGNLDITVYTQGQLLHPAVEVNTTHPAVGKAVSFSANLPGGAPSNPTFLWNFYDGPPKSADQTTSHAYTAAGTYYASVTVESGVGTSAASYGESPPVLITVGAAPPPAPTSSAPTGGTGGGSSNHPVVGPNKGRGTHPGAAPGKNRGAKPGPASSSAPRSSQPDPSQPNSSQVGPATPRPTLGGAPGAIAPGATSGATLGTTEPASVQPHDRSTPKPAGGAGFGALVHGVVIENAAQAAIDAQPRSSAPQATAPSARQATSKPFDARLLWWLLLPLLLGLGVVSEVRRPRPGRTPRG